MSSQQDLASSSVDVDEPVTAGTGAAPAAERDDRVRVDPDAGVVAGGDQQDPDQAYRDAVAEQLRLSRLRLYSYCMTLSACVLALMTFMYLVQGIGDGDGSFTSIGVVFAGATLVMLWGALRVTQLGDNPADHYA